LVLQENIHNGLESAAYNDGLKTRLWEWVFKNLGFSVLKTKKSQKVRILGF